MTLVDSHLHLWDRRRLDYPWLGHVPTLDRDFLPGDIDGGATAADRVVFVQADCLPEQGLAEAAWVSALGTEWSRLAGIVAFAPVDDPGALPAHLERLAGIPGVVGVRRLLQGEPDAFLRDPALAEGLRLLAGTGLTFDACVSAEQLPALIALKRGVPDLRLILDHLGKPPVRLGPDSAPGRAWAADLGELARLPGTYLKLSGLAPESDPTSPLFPQAVPFIDTALAAFGPGRCMLGSDWPVSARLPVTAAYDDWFTAVLDHLALEGEELAAVRHTTAERAYGLPTGR